MIWAYLSPGLEAQRRRHGCAAERSVGEETTVLAREGYSLRDALIDDVDAQLGQSVDVALARAEVTALDGVVEQSVNAVAVVPVILGGVYSALRSDAVGAARGILKVDE